MKLQRNRVYHLDCRKGFRLLRENDIKVSSIITSPPYWNLRVYDIENSPIWNGDQDCSHNFKTEIRETHSGSPSKKSGLRDDPKQKSREEWSKGIDSNKVEIGMCKKCGAWKGQLGAEPTPELYIKHLCDIFTEAKDVLRDDGTLWVNLGDTYKEKDLQLIPQRFVLEMKKRGWLLRNVNIWEKPNVIPSSASDRFTINFEYFYFFTKRRKYFFNQQYEPYKTFNREGVSQPPIGGKKHTTSKENPNECYSGNISKTSKKGRNKRTIWEVPTVPHKESHFAVFPPDLVEIPIKAGTPQYICQKCDKPITDKESHKCNSKTSVGIVLDPFAGIGTTLLKAFELGRDFIGFEISKKYWEIGKEKIQEKASFKRLDSF